MIFSNKELTFLSTLPVTIWGIFTTLAVIFSELVNASYVRLTMHFEENTNLIMMCFLYGLIGLTLNRIFEVYEERQLRRQNEGIL